MAIDITNDYDGAATTNKEFVLDEWIRVARMGNEDDSVFDARKLDEFDNDAGQPFIPVDLFNLLPIPTAPALCATDYVTAIVQ
jgi:hypothetical protein